MAAVFGVFGGNQEVVLSAIAGAIGLIAFSIFRDREVRQNLSEQVNEISNSLTAIRERMSADDFFHTESSDTEIIKQAKETVWLVQETGSKLIEDNFKSLERLAKNGGSICIILASADAAVLEMIAFRNRNLQHSDIKARHDSAVRKLVSLSQTLEESNGNLEVHIIQYPLDVTYVLVDAESIEVSNRQGLIRLSGFLDFFADKRDFSLNANREPSTYQYFVNQFKKMLEISEIYNLDLATKNDANSS